MRIVCDASPLVVLAKLDRLELIREVLPGEPVVLQCIVDELLTENAGPLEDKRLNDFFRRSEVIDFRAPASASRALSQSDRSTLIWAIENRAEWLVADDRLLRRVATENGISVVGFLGILVGAADRGVLSVDEVKTAIDDAVSEHGCRVSVALYRRLLLELDRIDSERGH